MKESNIKVGDIIIKSFKDNNGKWVPRHPFIVVEVRSNRIALIDQNAIFAGFAMSSEDSFHSSSLLNRMPSWAVMILNPEDGVNGKSLLLVNQLILFAKDILPVDKQGEINPDIVEKALKTFEKLEKSGDVQISLNNLPDLVQNKFEKVDIDQI